MSDDVAQLPDGIDESEREAWEIYISNGYDADADWFREHYLGCSWDSPEDYVEECVRDSENIPDSISYYIDWESMARDWELNGDFWYDITNTGVVHLFRS